MLLSAFLHGFILSFGLILPLGVQNLFVFNQGVAQASLGAALPVIVTACVCDTLLIVMAVEGVSLLLLQFSFLRELMIGGGIVFLLYMGLLAWRAGAPEKLEENAVSGRRQILFAASVSLLNPHAILDTIGVIGSSAMQYGGAERLYFTMACITVSWIWFFSLAITGRVLGRQARMESLFAYINKFSALFIWGSAAYMSYLLLTTTQTGHFS